MLVRLPQPFYKHCDNPWKTECGLPNNSYTYNNKKTTVAKSLCYPPKRM